MKAFVAAITVAVACALLISLASLADAGVSAQSKDGGRVVWTSSADGKTLYEWKVISTETAFRNRGRGIPVYNHVATYRVKENLGRN